MIKFFRRIRQQLISVNPPEGTPSTRAGKLSKYLMYAVGEIILVVIGILIALQINNWNERRKATQKEELYLAEIKSSLRADSLQVRDILLFNKEKVKIVQGFMRIFSDTLTNEERSGIIEKYFIPFTEYRTFVPNKTAWNNLITSESLNLVQNRELRTLLMEYYDFDYASSVQERIKTMNRKVVDENFPKFFTREYVMENLKMSTQLPASDESTIHLNQTFLSDLFGITYLIRVQDQGLENISTNIAEALELIVKRLEEI
ncbi:MAG: DUF6090 family protein [Bacteroidota bacterium]